MNRIGRLAFLLVIFCFMFSVFVSADSPKLDTSSDFYRSDDPKQAEKIAEILGMDGEEFGSYLSADSVLFVAVNKDNTKQIKITEAQSVFSEKTGDLSSYSDEEVLLLAGELAGGKQSAEVITQNNQKFILTTDALKDSGGEYTVAQYITVFRGKIFTLSFYTDSDTDTDYIRPAFESFGEDFFSEKQKGDSLGVVKIFVIIAGCLITLAALYIIYTVIRDLRKSKEPSA